MNVVEKKEFLENTHFNDWINTRMKIVDELSNKQSMFCVCGRLATGLHEGSCRKFNDRVNSETVKRLSYLFITTTKKAREV